MTFVIYWLVILSYQDFFFFDPADSDGLFRQITLWMFIVGWVVAAVVSPVLMMMVAVGSPKGLAWMPVAVLLWPVAIVLAQVSAYEQTGESHLGYLFDYPVFVLTDIALPAFLMIKWARMRQVITQMTTPRRATQSGPSGASQWSRQTEAVGEPTPQPTHRESPSAFGSPPHLR